MSGHIIFYLHKGYSVLIYYTHVVRHEHNGRTAHVARHPVHDIGPATEEVRGVPRQGHS